MTLLFMLLFAQWEISVRVRYGKGVCFDMGDFALVDRFWGAIEGRKVRHRVEKQSLFVNRKVYTKSSGRLYFVIALTVNSFPHLVIDDSVP